jgi:hypothetical protein
VFLNKSAIRILPAILLAGGTLLAASSQALAQRVGDTQNPHPVEGIRRFTAVAFDATNNAYLVAYGLSNVSARFVSADGIPLGSPVPLNTGGAGAPRVACGSGYCLVAWVQEPTSIVGRIVRFSGGAVAIVTDPFPISSNGFSKATAAGPTVAFSSSGGEFLVAWGEFIPYPRSRVLAQRVTLGGAVTGGEIVVSDALAFQAYPSATYNSARGEYVVAFHGESGATNIVTAVRVKAGTGAVLGKSSLQSGVFEQYPEIAYNSADGTFLAVSWGPGFVLHGQLADSALDPLGSTLTLSAESGGDGLGLAYNPVSNSYFAVFQHATNSEIWGVIISNTGVPGSKFQVTASGASSASFIAQPRVAASSRVGRWLAASSMGFKTIISQLVDSGGGGGGGGGGDPTPVAGPRVTALTRAPVSVSPMAGTPITVTASATASGPLEYQFWLYSYPHRSWRVAKGWSSSNQLTWTPDSLEAGWHKVQVWVRAAGSTGNPDHWMDLDPFLIQSASPRVVWMRVSAPGSSPSTPVGAAPINSPVTISALAAGGMSGLIEYQFWRYNTVTRRWSLDRPWATTNTYTWMPAASDEGWHRFQVWVREYGKSEWQDWASSQLNIASIVATNITPYSTTVARGTPVNLTVTAIGSTTGYEYRFWRYSVPGGGWTVEREYAASNTFQWVPTTGELGDNYFQVWIRRTNSEAPYTAVISTDVIRVH